MATVLLVGEDEFLLDTRAAVIRTTGAETLCCSSNSALEIQQRRPCDVVILCHSLPVEIRNALPSFIHSHWPETRILMLSSNGARDFPGNVECVDIVNSADPERLVLRTIELLRKAPGSEKSLNRFASIRSGQL
jgi:DNA-binding response OmpR family regulator